MNEDKLKGWIREEREQFETESPREGIWSDVEAQLQKEASPEKRSYVAWLVAASIALLMALVLFNQTETPKGAIAQEEVQEEQESQEAFAQMSDEMQEAQSFYASQVDDRMNELSKYPVDADLKEEMDLLTEEFEVLSSEMGQGLDDSKVVEAMIDNYRLRLDLLEDLLKALDEKPNAIKTNNTREHEL